MAPAPPKRSSGARTSASVSKFKSKSKPLRGNKTQMDELKFDFDARQDYLTGFHKRKVQRIKHAQEEAAKKEKEEKVVNRRELREERKKDLERHVAEVNMLLRKNNPDISDDDDELSDRGMGDEDGEDGEWGGIAEKETIPKPDGVDEYVDEDKYTTVTIETMDDDPRNWSKEVDEEAVVTEGDAETAGAAETDDGTDKKRVWTKEKPKKTPGEKKKKQQKFRYESKAERQQTRAKQRSKNKAAAADRKAAAPTERKKGPNKK